MDARVKEIADRLEALVAAKDPMSDFVLTFFRNTLDQWGDLTQVEPPPPFGDTPLLQLVESMLPTVEAQDRSSSAVSDDVRSTFSVVAPAVTVAIAGVSCSPAT